MVVQTKTLIANLLWRNFEEKNRKCISIEEIDMYKKNLLNYLSANYERYSYTFKFSETTIISIVKKNSWLFMKDNMIYINRNINNWSSMIDSTKNYYKYDSPLKEAFANAELPFVASTLKEIYKSNTYNDLIKKLTEEKESIELKILDFESNNKQIIDYLNLKESVKEFNKKLLLAKTQLLEDCTHDIFYVEKNIDKNIGKCLCCGMIKNTLELNEFLVGKDSYQEVKDLYDELSEITTNLDVIKSMLHSEIIH